jgi:UDP-N-acetylmuramoyl-tripeptide--D-alanyl-D-alanine ligase
VLTLAQVAEATGGEIVGAPGLRVASVTTDTRGLEPGALFVALRGDRFDGHAFVSDALGAGAVAALVSDASVACPAVVVPDTLRALQRLAAWHRQRMPARVVGITGSAGKTTTKELTSSILARLGPTLATRGNLNNHIGVPLTLLRLEPSHAYAVIEMGCNGFGEIALLAGLARPEAGLITNVGEAHLEGLGDLAGVARAKGELFAALEPAGTAVTNLDDSRVRALPSPARRRLGYGRVEGAEVRLARRRPSREGRQELEIELGAGQTIAPGLELLGAHNAANAVAAAALALAVGATAEAIEAGLGAVTPAPGRLQPRAGAGGLVVIDDTYNANPGAMEAALTVLCEHSGAARLHALLGEMLELGPESRAQHVRVGRLAAGLPLESLVATGVAAGAYLTGAREGGMAGERLAAAETPEAAAEVVLRRSRPGDVVLVKGSRGAHMERAVAVLCAGVVERDLAGAP